MNINEYPLEIMGNIFSFLPTGRPSFDIDPLFLCRARAVCKSWQVICEQQSPWNPFLSIYQRQFSEIIPPNLTNAYHFYVEERNLWKDRRGGRLEVLVYAIYRGWEKQIGFLINKKGINFNDLVLCVSKQVNLESSYYKTKYAHEEMCERDHNHTYTPLRMAIRTGNLATIDLLLKVPGIDKVVSGDQKVPLILLTAEIALYLDSNRLVVIEKLLSEPEVLLDDAKIKYLFLGDRKITSLETLCRLFEILVKGLNHFNTKLFLERAIKKASYSNLICFPLIESVHKLWMQGKINSSDFVILIPHLSVNEAQILFDRTPSFTSYTKIRAALRNVAEAEECKKKRMKTEETF